MSPVVKRVLRTSIKRERENKKPCDDVIPVHLNRKKWNKTKLKWIYGNCNQSNPIWDLKNLKWDSMDIYDHPPYSPDLIQSDYFHFDIYQKLFSVLNVLRKWGTDSLIVKLPNILGGATLCRRFEKVCFTISKMLGTMRWLCRKIKQICTFLEPLINWRYTQLLVILFH